MSNDTSGSNIQEKAEKPENIGVFGCRWGINIAGVVDIPLLLQELGKIEGVKAFEYLSFCTEGGAQVIADAIKKHDLKRIVVAACTPRTHEPVFHAVLRDAGIPPRMLEFVNIREHCSFVHMTAKDRATQKALRLIEAAIQRARLLEEVPTKTVEVTPRALVVGGGIAGLSAAVELGDQGYEVVLVEKNPTIGGRMAQLDRTFPTDDCSIWILGPKMLAANRHEKITIYTNSEVHTVNGYVGNFEAAIKRNPRLVLEDKCNGCGACADVCPVFVPNYFDEGLSARKCIDKTFAQAVPSTYDINNDKCLHCYACVESCDLHAIDFSQKPEIVWEKVGAIIGATGWDLYAPEGHNDYGYGTYDNVVTQLELERLLAPNGPNLGHLTRVSDHKSPKRVAFINCVGSRGKVHPHCSNVCCLLSIKNAQLIKAEFPDAEIVVNYIDIRCAGRDYEEYYQRAREAGIIFVKGLASAVREDPETKNLRLTFESIETGDIIDFNADLVVLSSASLPSKGTGELAQILKLERTPTGFLKEFHARLSPVETKTAGVYIAGSCQGQKPIDAAVNQGKGAAAAAASLLSKDKYEIELIRAYPDGNRCSECYECVEACPYSAITLAPGSGVQVDPIKCRGCGLCEATCKSQAIKLRYYREKQYNALIDTLLAA